MPFYAKDWRSPGESWIKTEDGWEKLKILECRRRRSRSMDDDKENDCSSSNDVVVEAADSLHLEKLKGEIPPYCQITLKCTKEVAGFNGLSDALRRLDFCSAVHDHRRFPYTAKLLELLLSQQRITTLSGCAQKSVLNVLEEIAVEAQQSQQNVHVLSKLLSDLRRIVRGDSWWGQPLGSSQLWGKHVRTIDRIDAIASSIRSGSRADASSNNDGSEEEKPKFEDLPEECIREILFRLADHRDLISAAEAYGVAQKLSAEQRLWKRLCRFHFSQLQISFIMTELQKEREKPPLTAVPLTTNNTNLNKINRNNNRTVPHPYLSNNNNGSSASRRSPARGQVHEPDPSSSSGSATNSVNTNSSEVELLDNGIVETGSRVRVSNAFHEHLNRHRENLLSRSQSVQEPSVQDAAVICTNDDNHARLISFQDVRNHFDQHPENNSISSAPLSRQVQQKKNKKDDNELTSRGTDWEDIFHRCRRLFGLREDYAETLHLCRNCRCLFWKTYGHPCIETNNQSLDNNNSLESDPESYYVPVPPQAFLKFFSL